MPMMIGAAQFWFVRKGFYFTTGGAEFRHQLDVQVAVDHPEEVARQQQRLLLRYNDIETLEAQRSQLAAEIADADAEASATFRDAECEVAGTCGSGHAGIGPLHNEKLRRFEELQRHADQVRSQDAPLLRALTAQIDRRENQREEELASFEKMTHSSDGLLTRLLALQHLKSDPQRDDCQCGRMDHSPADAKRPPPKGRVTRSFTDVLCPQAAR